MCGATMRMRSFCAAAPRCGYWTRASLSGGFKRNIATNVTRVTNMGGATVGDYCGKVAVTASGAIRMLGFKGVGMAQEIRMKLTINGTPRVRRIVAAIDCGDPVNPDGIAQQV